MADITLTALAIIGGLSILLFLILQIPHTIWWLISVIMGPLIGAFVGVYLGFLVNETQRKKLGEEKRSFFKNLLMHEVNKSLELLEEGGVNLIPMDMWNSVVNSGNIALLEGSTIELGNLYFEIQNYNYEAKRIRDATEEANLHPTSTDPEHVKRLRDKFDSKTLPSLKEYLTNYKNRITIFRIKPGKITIGGSEVGSVHTDKNGNVIRKY